MERARLILGLVVLITPACSAPQAQWIAPVDSSLRDPLVAPFWIWVSAHQQPAATTASAPAGTVFLSRSFDLTAEARPASARLWLAADNHATAFVNGTQVLHSDAWSAPSTTVVTLQPGRNTLAIRAVNDPGAGLNPAGVIAHVEAHYSDGRVIQINTDSSWRGGHAEWSGWPAAAAPPDSSAVTILGPANASPWGLAAGSFTEQRPCPILRRRFTLKSQPVQGSVRVVGLGHYKLRLNGRDVGDAIANQAWSQYNRTLYWQEFDIAPLLQRGENVFGVMLGNSFWHVGPPNDGGRFSKTDAMPDFSGGQPYLVWLEARMRGADGTVTVITSDGDWKWTNGPLTFSHIYAGEDYDARNAPRGWDAAGYDDSGWRGVQVVPPPPASLAPLQAPPIRAFEIFQPTQIREPEPGVFTYLFPQNCSAVLRFVVDGPAGRTVRFKPCEYMDVNGKVRFTYTWGTGKDIWHDYTLRGGGPEAHQILFCYVGCQFVEVTGAVPEGHANPSNLPVVRRMELVHTRTDNKSVGAFSCSSDMQVRAHNLIDWAIRSNMSHVATDCPHREKNGWQEQNWHMARAIGYRYDVHDWFCKIARDIRDTQLPDGHIPTNCPNYLVGVPPHGFWNEAPEWGVAGVLVPWHLYEWYGDREALAAAYDSMKRYVDYLGTQAKDGILRSNLGDWYDYGHGKGDGPSRWTPNEVSATAIWALAASTLRQTAEVLSRPDDAARFAALFASIRDTFQARFYDAATHTVKNNGSCQAANATALCVGLVPEADRKAALDAIVADLERRDWQQTTGEVLHIFLIRALAEGGRGDVLHRVYAREAPGSYGHMVKTGLTTLPESWDAKPGTGNSLNHFMLGQLVEWHFAYVAGIRQAPGGVGWRRIVIAPQPGPLTTAEASFTSPAGRIVSRWKRTDRAFELTTEVPPGVDGEAILPDGSKHRLRTGTNLIHGAMP